MKYARVGILLLVFFVLITPSVSSAAYELDPGDINDNWMFIRRWEFRLKNYKTESVREAGDYNMYYSVSEYVSVYGIYKIAFSINFHKVLSLKQYDLDWYEDFDLYYLNGYGNSFISIDLPDPKFVSGSNIDGDKLMDMYVSYSNYFTCPANTLVGISSSGETGTNKFMNVIIFRAGVSRYPIKPNEIYAILADGVDYSTVSYYFCSMLDWFSTYSTFNIPTDSWFYYGIKFGDHIFLKMYDGTVVDTYYL